MSGDATTYWLRTDASGVVICAVASNAAQDGMAQVDAATYAAAVPGLTTYMIGVVQPYAPPPVPAPPPTVTGNQWAFAMSNMGLSSAWRIGVTKSKDSDQVRIGLISRSTLLVASDPLLIRVAGNAGNDANGNPLISVPTVFSTAQGMPL